MLSGGTVIAYKLDVQLRRTLLSVTLFCIFLAFQGNWGLFAWSPGTGSPKAAQDFVVDSTIRNDVLSFYNCIYNASENYQTEIGWSGTVSATLGVAGTTSTIFKEDVRRRINFYRALVSMPADITFDATECSKDQDAVLMFSRNSDITHNPPSNWLSYTSTGAEAAGHSNLAIGFNIATYGPEAINGYMRDDGPGNETAGHRRWLTYSQARIMGTGDIPLTGTFACSNANWVIGNFKPSPVLQFVSWPNSGYIPLPLVPARWSLTYPGANFSNASVSMIRSGTAVPVQIISSADNGYGDNTIVWVPAGMPPASIGADTTCNVTVSGIAGAGVPSSYSYVVTMFDPDTLNDSITITGTASPDVNGAIYTFNSIPGADSLDLQVSVGSTAAWTEGAEDLPVPQVQPATTGTYALRQMAVVRTGSKAFHLTFPAYPDFSDQGFEITRSVIPDSSSALVFYECFHFVTTDSRLSAEISADNGTSWVEIWGRSGNGSNSSTGWDSAFNLHSISLAGYAGTPVLVRFVLRTGFSAFFGQDQTTGVFLDDITITNGTELINTTNTNLSGTASSFTLDALTAGSPLAADTSYYLQIRPSVGLRWYGFGTTKTVRTSSTNSNTSTTGSLQVTIQPAEAVNSGAEWQVDGGAWHPSGGMITGLSTGIHTVAFNTVNGWSAPGIQALMVNANSVATTTGTFTSTPASGLYFQNFNSTPPLWDISGDYSGDIGSGIKLNFSIHQDSSGKISGAGTISSDDGSGTVLAGPATITGAVKSSGNATLVSMTVLTGGSGTVTTGQPAAIHPATFTGRVDLHCEINPAGGGLVVTGRSFSARIMDSVTGRLKSQVTPIISGAVLALPNNVNGNWNMLLDLVTNSSKNSGQATIQTSTGFATQLSATGSYSPKTGTSKITLSGNGCALSMVISTSGTNMTSQRLKGTVYGQKFNYVAP